MIPERNVPKEATLDTQQDISTKGHHSAPAPKANRTGSEYSSNVYPWQQQSPHDFSRNPL